mmetsp:Transcript_56336/g.121392  ORF Transcript_56336/g.121392 Transcript_56336/m.121392 type:complete len:463 (-) Transcript_56336:12-1400(-)
MLVALEASSPRAERPSPNPFACSTRATYALFILFGAGSWLTVNGLFTELPLLVARLPESWRLASVLAVAVQLANVGPFLFCLAERRQRWRALRWESQRGSGASSESFAAGATYGVLALGAVAMAGLALCWSATIEVAGIRHSLPLLAFAFVAALADCTSSVLFWRFAGSFRPVHLSALAAGEGMSGVIASGLAWLQAASRDEPWFSAGAYFAMLGMAMCASAVAFHLLRRAPFAKAERRRADEEQAGSGGALSATLFSKSCEEVSGDGSSVSTNTAVTANLVEADEGILLWTREMVGLLMLQAWLNVLQNGISVSCLGLAAKPYGRAVYQRAQTFALFIDPLAAALGYRIRIGARGLLPVALCLGAIYGYILALSLSAVLPPFLPEAGGGGGGGVLLVALAGVGRALTAYSKMRASVLLHGAVPQRCAGRLLMLSGVAMQSGALLGTTAMFALINGTSLFRS